MIGFVQIHTENLQLRKSEKQFPFEQNPWKLRNQVDIQTNLL